MWPIYKKELRGLVPMWVLCFIVISGDLIYRPFTERLDEKSWADISLIESGSGGELAFVFALLAFVVAYAAFPREHEERTLAYLSSLPVSPSSIFWGKITAGLTVLLSTVAIGQLTNWWLSSWNLQTFEGNQFRLGTSLTLILLQAAFVFVAYCHGLLASFFRRFGLLPYALLIWMIAIAQNVEPTLSWLSPVSIVRLAYHGQVLLVPVFEVSFHIVIALGALALAAFLWLGPTERLQEIVAPRQGRTGWGSIGFGCATALLVLAVGIVVITVVGLDANENEPEDPEAAEYVSFVTADAETEHYAFTYPVNLRLRALDLIASADSIFEGARASLGAEEGGAPINVDLAEVNGTHEGIAAGSRVRMGLVGQADEMRLRFVLAHESTHVLQTRESRNRLGEAAGAGRFLAEGSAEWVAHEVVDVPSTRRASRVVAAASYERHRLRFEDVVEDESLRARHDTTLVYSLGEMWSDALERACGEGALGRVLRAVGAESASRDLVGLAFVQDALQRAGCSHEEVDARWVALIDETLATERASVDALPRMGAALEPGENGRVRIVARLDRPVPAQADFQVRIRQDRSSLDSQLRSAAGRIEGERVVFEVPRSTLPGARFELQLCVAPAPNAWTFCELWQSAMQP